MRIAILVLAFIAPPAIAGGLTLYLRMRTPDVPEAATRDDIATPPARPPVTTKRLAVIVAGNRGTEITDSLPMLELLEESGAFEVRVVAPRRVLSPFKSSGFASAGLDFFPDLGFEDYDRLVGRAPDLVVVPYLPAWENEDAAVVPWIRSHVGPDTMLLSICDGAWIVAATGLFDGHRATGHFMNLADLTAKYPGITYVSDVRWVRDGKRMSSAALAAGLDATLAAIDTLAGRDAALRAAAGISYHHVEFLDDPASPTSVSLVGAALEIAYRWEHTRVAVVIDKGTSESSIAALFDAYAQTLSAHSVAVATSRNVLETRHGLRVLARDTTNHLGSYSTVTFATLDHGGLSPYDAAIYAVANTHGRPMARLAGSLVNYPTSDLDLAGGVPVGLTMLLRALALGLAGIGALLLVRFRSAATGSSLRAG
ncbi:MAG: DJ-1/PfpI family protein [Deltaproteobacteria bacterium]|nr:DJ-1/PfpI family protein [Deltaproteobacteria bacterium]